MSDKICAIHQPNFFPWLGYFDKINKCRKFVVLDDVQFPKKGGAWMNRVAIIVADKKNWITAPIIRSSGLFKVNEVEFDSSFWRDKLKKTIQTNYARASYFKKYVDMVFCLIDYSSNNLSDYNINTISEISRILDIDFEKKRLLSSTLGITTASTQRLIDITRTMECDTYMTGGGAGGYQEDDEFKKQRLNVIYQNFKHPVYEQKGMDFVPGLSILDSLFNVGVDGIREILI